MKYFNLLFFFIIILFDSVFGQNVTFKITKLPKKHNFAEPVFIAGNFNNWNPADSNYRMSLNSDSSYTFTFKNISNFEFKFTRGNWQIVEKDYNCNDIPNRILSANKDIVLNLQIDNWSDNCSDKHSAQKNVSILNQNFFIPQLHCNRRIWIYLPLDYYETSKRYPVLYMHDGQNLFDVATSFAGEWQIDESINDLYNKGYQSCIVVGIDNGAEDRLNEYSPWINKKYGGGNGDLYARFIVETLKPFIDSNFRTLSDRQNTGIMGSSMGGLISLYVGLKYQDVFSKVGVFSPAFWFSDSSYKFASQIQKKFPIKFYFLAGGKEKGVSSDCEKMIGILKKSGFANDEFFLKTVPQGSHNEVFWRKEFPEAYLFLFNNNH